MKFLALSFLIISSVWAAPDTEYKMATITSNIDKDTGRFYIQTDENGDVDSLRYTITTADGKVSEDITHPWERIRDGGVVLVHRNGHDVLKLQVDSKFSPQTGGGVRINYLFSGVSGTRYNLSMNVSRTETAYELKREAKLVNTLYIQGNWNVFVGLIGIANISTSYKAPLFYADPSSFE